MKWEFHIKNALNKCTVFDRKGPSNTVWHGCLIPCEVLALAYFGARIPDWNLEWAVDAKPRGDCRPAWVYFKRGKLKGLKEFKT